MDNIPIDDVLGLHPRFMLGLPPQLYPRQDVVCPSDSHGCLDISAAGSCCANTAYCYVGVSGTTASTKCCDVSRGQCPDDPCSSGSYHCTVSSTTTCCPRPCPAVTLFQCAQSLGGNCCPLDLSCGGSNQCLSFASSSSTSNAAALPSNANPAPTGCTIGQYSCAASVGGGCCNNGEVCTESSKQLFCAAAITTTVRPGNSALATNTSTSSSSASMPSRLTTGAIAGIAVGAVIAIAFLAGLIWFFIGRRRHQRRSEQSESSLQTRQAMSQIHRQTASTNTAAGGGGQDYFGAAPQAGPFTEHNSDDAAAVTSLSVTPRGAVPLTPQGPGDIVVPVEIGGTGRVEEIGEGDIGRALTSGDEYPKQMEPVELPG